jgi:hypothetical protein
VRLEGLGQIKNPKFRLNQLRYRVFLLQCIMKWSLILGKQYRNPVQEPVKGGVQNESPGLIRRREMKQQQEKLLTKFILRTEEQKSFKNKFFYQYLVYFPL